MKSNNQLKINRISDKFESYVKISIVIGLCISLVWSFAFANLQIQLLFYPRTLIQTGLCQVEFDRFVFTGQDAVMTNTGKAVWQRVQGEPSDKLWGF